MTSARQEHAVRKVVVHMQVTLDGRISNSAGLFWEPLRFGDPETASVNDAFRAADTWAMSRALYEFVVPLASHPGLIVRRGVDARARRVSRGTTGSTGDAGVTATDEETR